MEATETAPRTPGVAAPPAPRFFPLSCRWVTTHGPRGSFAVQGTRSDFPRLTSLPRASCQADETPSWRGRATAVTRNPSNSHGCPGIGPDQLPLAERCEVWGWRRLVGWIAALVENCQLEAAIPRPRIAVFAFWRQRLSGSQPPGGGGTGWSRRGLGEATYNGRIRATRFV